MKTVKMFLVFLISFNAQVYAKLPQGIYRIEIDPYAKDDSYRGLSKKELQRRIQHLERAVWALQNKVYDLQSTQQRQALADKQHTCMLTSNFGKTYTGTDISVIKAKSIAINNCHKGEASGIFCKEEKVTCD